MKTSVTIFIMSSWLRLYNVYFYGILQLLSVFVIYCNYHNIKNIIQCVLINDTLI